MTPLPHRHLTTLELDVDFANVVRIGPVPRGHRGIATVTGGTFAGERLSGSVLPGHDWFVTRGDGVLAIDVRVTLQTGDGVPIFLAYAGRMLASDEAMARFMRGELLAADDYSLVVSARFECGDARYSWLNDVVAVGVGEQRRAGPAYTLYEIG